MLRNLRPDVPSLCLPQPPPATLTGPSVLAPPPATASASGSPDPTSQVDAGSAPATPQVLQTSGLFVLYEADLTIPSAALEPEVLLQEGDTPPRTAAPLPAGRSPPVFDDEIPDCDMAL